MPDMSAEAALPSRITQPDTSKTKPSGRFQGLRERVSKIFNGNMLVTPDEIPIKTEPNIIAGRKLPELDNGTIPPMTFPDRPEGFSRPENIGELKVIHETPDGPVIDTVGGKPHTLLEEMDEIKELVPEERRKELDIMVEELISPKKTQLDPVDALKNITDPTDRQFALGEFARLLAFNQLTNGGVGGNVSPGILNPRIEKIYSEYKLKVFPPIKRVA